MAKGGVDIKLTIRLGRESDYAAIASLHRQTIRQINSRDYPENIIAVWSARPSVDRLRSVAHERKLWVAETAGKIIGFVDHNFHCEIMRLYVHNKYIGLGICSRLLATAERSLKKFGCHRITIRSSITAKHFYLDHGYKVIRRTYDHLMSQRIAVYLLSKHIS